MRVFILLVTLATLAAGQYNYNPVSAPVQQPSTFSGSAIASPVIQAPQQQFAPAPAPAPAPAQHREEVSKEFYTFAAPEEQFAIPQQEQQSQSVTKKNFQVVFIRAPEQAGHQRVLQNLIQQNLEQQTAIYVLSKQPDLSQITQNIQQTSQQIQHKPEVHFIKYRTQEDAQRAQQSIRAQYDALGGSTSHNDGGVAPVLNFASQRPVQQAQQTHHVQQQQAPAAPSQTYLPSYIRF